MDILPLSWSRRAPSPPSAPLSFSSPRGREPPRQMPSCLASDDPAAAHLTAETPAPPSPLVTTLEALSFSPPPNSSSAAASSANLAPEGGRRTVATPYAKKLAKDLKVELGSVAGSGPMGRIVAKDVEAAAAVAVAAPVSTSPPKSVSNSSAVKAPASRGLQLSTVVPFTTMQGAVSKNMVESFSVPTFRIGYSMTTNARDDLYKKIKSKEVTMTALLAKATAMALMKHPIVNSSCRDGKSFTYNCSINIAVAVAIDGGLITPVLQDADKVDIYSLSRKWKELVDKARAKQLQPPECNTGTFTLSNLGMFGVDCFDAILPSGTGAIMAVGASQPTVVATKDGRIGVKSQMQVNITADHRIIYGADLAAFLQTLAKVN